VSLLQKIKNRGVLHSLEIVFNRFVPAWMFRYSNGIVFELDLEKLSRAHQELDCTQFVLTRVDGSDQWESLRKLTWNSVPQETTGNHSGYAISRRDADETMVGGVWGGVDQFNESDLGFQMRLASDQAWIYCAYVDKNTRGEGVYQRVLAFAAHDLGSRGYTRLRVIIQPWNRASLFIHQKYAVGPLGRIFAIRTFGLATIFCTGEIRKSKTFTTRLLADPVLIDVP